MRNDAKKLDQLTSLRFFAAMMIVVVHARTVFGFEVEFALGQGVSFFYVLSGFILYFVYPKLESAAAVRDFLRARIARIVPAYLASFLLGWWLLNYVWDTPTALAHVAMVQSWIPLPSYYYSYNDVAWSVSTEMFFYLAFPLLLWRWDATWKLKLLATLVPVVGFIILAGHLSLPETGVAGFANGMSVTQQGLLYVNPLSRLFEFALGMAIGLAWRRSQPGWSTATATALELGTVALCALSLFVMYRYQGQFARTNQPAAIWVTQSGGSALFLAGLIHVFAQGRGLLSRLLAHRALVLLGEISFSIYLLHYILLEYIRSNEALFPVAPQPLRFAIFLAMLLLASFLMWALVELPGRRLLRGPGPVHGTELLTRTWRDHVRIDRNAMLAAVALAALVALVHFSKFRPDAGAELDVAADTARTPAPHSCYIDTVNAAVLSPGQPMAADGDVVIEGWVLSETTRRTGLPARLRLLEHGGTGAWEFAITDWTARPDVQQALQGIDDGNAGFRQHVGLGDVPSALYRVTVVFDEAGTSYLCDMGALLDLR